MRPWRKIRSLSLMQKMTALFVVVGLLPCAVFSIVVYQQSFQQQMADMVNQNTMMLRSLAQDISTRAAQVEVIVKELAGSEKVISLLSAETVEEHIIIMNRDIINDVARAQTHLAGISARILILSKSDRIAERFSAAVRESRLEGDAEYQSFLTSGALSAWGMPCTMIPGLLEEGEVVIPYYYKVFSGKLERLGSIKCGIRPENLFASLNEWNTAGTVMVLRAGELIYQKGQEAPIPVSPCANTSFAESDHLYSIIPMENMDFMLAYALPYAVLREQAMQSSIDALLVCLLVTCLLWITTRLLLSSILRRLHQTVQSIKQIRKGQYQITLPDDGGDEVGELVHAFNTLLSQINKNVDELLRKEQDKRSAQALALQYQINPHFLFNSLYWLQMRLESRQADINGELSDAIASLGEVLRYNLSELPTATLLQERQLMREYIHFMSKMKNSDIQLNCAWDEELDSISIMRFTFQPLLENAILHGLIPKRALRIDATVSQHEEEGKLWICVANNGMPIPREQLQRLTVTLRQPLGDDTASHTHGIGLLNLARRLRLSYGSAAEVDITSSEHKTTITIQIPIEVSTHEISNCG